ncbi:hypothetical protein ACM66B_002622 [Microbotryomycetes sp. NB124-2]
MAHILRRSLAAPVSNGSAAFVLPCRKLVFEYCESWGSNKGMREFLGRGDIVKVAERNPGVEIVLRRVDNRHPHIKGVYMNGRDKVVCVRNLEPASIMNKAQLLLDSSGSKITTLKRPKVESTNESVRGIWSAFHAESAR